MAQIFRYPDGVWPNVAALAFTLLGYGVGVALLGADSWTLSVLGLALVVALVAYLRLTRAGAR